MFRCVSKKRPKESAFEFFTLVELLVVISIIVILASLLLPALGRARGKAKEALCAGNLKQNGAAIQLYASDFNGIAVMHIYKSGGWVKGASATWLQMLDGTWDVEYLTSKETVLCPSFAPEKYYNIGRIYGANIGSANSAEFIPAGYTTGPMVKLSRLSSPTAYRFLSDSYSPSANEQSYIVYRWATSSQPGIHLRHFRRANIVFADGHVAGHGESDMEPLEIYRGYSDGCVYMTF